jgi:hypothetical protein
MTMDTLVNFFSGEPLVIVCVLLTLALIHQTRKLDKLQDRMNAAADQTQQERIELQKSITVLMSGRSVAKEGRSDEAS